MGKTTEFLGIINCPVCGELGQLQRFKRRYFSKKKWNYVLGNKWYYRVTHYNGKIDKLKYRPHFRGKYDHTCYLGKDYYG